MARWVWFVHPSHTSEGVTCITAPLRESLCHVYCHVPRYAAWLQTHQTHLQEYRYWECHGDPHERVQTYSSKHTCPQLCYERSQTAQKSKSTFKNAVLCINKYSVIVMQTGYPQCGLKLDRIDCIVSHSFLALYLNLTICRFCLYSCFHSNNGNSYT